MYRQLTRQRLAKSYEDAVCPVVEFSFDRTTIGRFSRPTAEIAASMAINPHSSVISSVSLTTVF